MLYVKLFFSFSKAQLHSDDDEEKKATFKKKLKASDCSSGGFFPKTKKREGVGECSPTATYVFDLDDLIHHFYAFLTKN